jgi:hypothetical protein
MGTRFRVRPPTTHERLQALQRRVYLMFGRRPGLALLDPWRSTTDRASGRCSQKRVEPSTSVNRNVTVPVPFQRPAVG